MLSDYLTAKPTLETPRLILRPLVPEDAASLRRWLARDEIYTYWGRKASKNEREPELMFIDPRPWVKRKPDPDFKWGIVLKETNAVIGGHGTEDQARGFEGGLGGEVIVQHGTSSLYRISPARW